MDLKPLHFFDEPIIPAFDIPPSMEKKQGCPNAFTWRDVEYRVIELVKEWHDYSRKGAWPGICSRSMPQLPAIADHGEWAGIIILSKWKVIDISKSISTARQKMWTTEKGNGSCGGN